jgi:hypothetical protein
MALLPSEVRVAVNVMRARLTVVGFNLAVITYQLNAAPRLPGAVPLPELGKAVHLATDTTLLLGLALSAIAMVCFVASCSFDQQGSCDHWALLAGDIFMYLGLAQSVSGFFAPYMAVLDTIAPAQAGASTSLAAAHAALLVSGSVAWLAATYVGPVVSLLRSPFGIAPTGAVALAYLLLLAALAYVSAETLRFEATHRDGGDGSAFSIQGELVQPLRW